MTYSGPINMVTTAVLPLSGQAFCQVGSGPRVCDGRQAAVLAWHSAKSQHVTDTDDPRLAEVNSVDKGRKTLSTHLRGDLLTIAKNNERFIKIRKV